MRIASLLHAIDSQVPHRSLLLHFLRDGAVHHRVSWARIGTRICKESLARACGATLAHAHARTGDRFAIAAYLGETDEFDRQLVKFARAYADQNEADYALFLQAREAGEL